MLKGGNQSGAIMKGIWTALITPFTVTGDLDISAFKRILRDQVDAGVAGVIPCGTTGESPTLTLEENRNENWNWS